MLRQIQRKQEEDRQRQQILKQQQLQQLQLEETRKHHVLEKAKEMQKERILEKSRRDDELRLQEIEKQERDAQRREEDADQPKPRIVPQQRLGMDNEGKNREAVDSQQKLSKHTAESANDANDRDFTLYSQKGDMSSPEKSKNLSSTPSKGLDRPKHIAATGSKWPQPHTQEMLTGGKKMIALESIVDNAKVRKPVESILEEDKESIVDMPYIPAAGDSSFQVAIPSDTAQKARFALPKGGNRTSEEDVKAVALGNRLDDLQFLQEPRESPFSGQSFKPHEKVVAFRNSKPHDEDMEEDQAYGQANLPVSQLNPNPTPNPNPSSLQEQRKKPTLAPLDDTSQDERGNLKQLPTGAFLLSPTAVPHQLEPGRLGIPSESQQSLNSKSTLIPSQNLPVAAPKPLVELKVLCLNYPRADGSYTLHSVGVELGGTFTQLLEHMGRLYQVDPRDVRLFVNGSPLPADLAVNLAYNKGEYICCTILTQSPAPTSTSNPNPASTPAIDHIP